MATHKNESPDILGQLEANLAPRKVSVIEFAESKQFCNRVLYPRQKLLLKLIHLEELTDQEETILDYWIKGGSGGNEIQISPFIRERREYLKTNGYKHFREIVLVGGRRCSKGFITGLCIAKKIYDLIQLNDPNKHYGIDADKEIYFSCVAAALEQASDQQYADVAGMVNSCKALQRHIFKVQEHEFSLMTEKNLRQMAEWKRNGRRVQRDISTIRGKALPANARTIRGSATMAYVFDEFAHFLQGDSDQADAEVYASAVPSLAQFGRDAMIWCNSSPYSKVGMFFERYEESMAADNAGPSNPLVMGIRLPSWALYEGWWADDSYVGLKKCVTVSPDWDYTKKKENGEYFYTEDDRQAITAERYNEQEKPDKYKVERRGQFAEVIDSYLNPEAVDRMFSGKPDELGQPVPLHTNRVNASNSVRYKMHLDPSSTTAGFALSMGHVETLQVNNVIQEHVIIDIVKRWEPKDFAGGVIDWQPILDDMIYLIDIFRPYEVTMDLFNSDYPISWLNRELRRRKIGETRVYQKAPNAQSNWDRAEVFKTALYRNLIHAPNDTPDCSYAADELKFLQQINTARVPRVEKQTVGSIQTKDMADCLMEVVEGLIGNTIARDVRLGLGSGPAMGAQGGYQIGGAAGGGDHALSHFYHQRGGEQRYSGRPSSNKPSPSRRVAGGKPVPRKLPGW